MFRRTNGSSHGAGVLADELRDALHMSDDDMGHDPSSGRHAFNGTEHQQQQQYHPYRDASGLSPSESMAYAVVGFGTASATTRDTPKSIERRNLLCVLQHAVRYLLDGSVGRVVDDADENLARFSTILEAVLDHGIRSGKKKWMGADKAGYYGFFEPVLKQLRSPITESVREMNDVKTARGKGRAFIRHALMEKRLAQYVQKAIGEFQLVSDWYEEWAVLRNEQSQVLIGVLVGLNAVDFGLCLRGLDLDAPDYPIDYAFFLEAPRRRLHVNTPSAAVDDCGGLIRDMSIQPSADEEMMRRMTSLHEQKAYLEELVRSKEMALENESRANAASLRELAHATARVDALVQQLSDERHQAHEIILELQRQVGQNTEARRIGVSGQGSAGSGSSSYGDRTRHTFERLPDSVLGL
eukprot:Opistho-2@16434